jgi:signal transduction histidine kinase
MVGVPLPAVDAEFFEIASTPELARTLDTLRVVLTAFAVATALAGAVLGRYAARRVVAPLDNVAGAAARIAGGALDTRLATTEDPDLATIVGSFNSMVDAVHERIERDARFAADVSHELRSPLTALVTGVEVLQRRRNDLPERSQRALDLIDRDLRRFQRALEDLLELGRLEAGAAGSVKTTVDARDLVRHALEASGRPAELMSVPDQAPRTRVSVDKSQLQRALVNLFENADRHGGGLTGVSVTGTPTGVLIGVEDRGPGVATADRERIFERFVRGGSRGSLPGTGLGLSLVAETIRAHGGAVWCGPGPDGVGARFTVRLPVCGPSEPQS